MFIDTHTHFYDARFAADEAQAMQRALDAGVQRLYLPNCDSSTIGPMLELAARWPQHCYPMMGLHPCYVNEQVEAELAIVAEHLSRGGFAAVGEIGLDYYWDKTHTAQQKEAFSRQIDWALQYELPIVIHSRESTADCIDMVAQKQDGRLRGIFHCFGGSLDEARQIVDLGLLLGIGGVLTYKKSTLQEVVAAMPLESMVLETDAPYLPPVPYRGKRNESAYIPLIAAQLAAIKNVDIATVAQITTEAAQKIFRF